MMSFFISEVDISHFSSFFLNSRVHEENEERRERAVQLVQLGLPVLRVPLEMTVPKAALYA